MCVCVCVFLCVNIMSRKTDAWNQRGGHEQIKKNRSVARRNSAVSREIRESLASSAPSRGGFDPRYLNDDDILMMAMTMTMTMVRALKQKRVHALRGTASKIDKIKGCHPGHLAEGEIRFQFRDSISRCDFDFEIQF